MPRVVDMRIRVTELFRRVDGKWRLIHRHADMPST
jgi:ketosteroid isomerase-like protein